MQIFYKALDGKTKVLEVEELDTIQNVRLKIEKKEGISSWNVNYYITFAGKRLDNQMTLFHYNIKKENTLFLRLSSVVRNISDIFIRILRGQFVDVELDSFDTKADIMAKIEKKIQISVLNHKHFSFATRYLEEGNIMERWIENEKIISLEFKDFYAIENIKYDIREKTGIRINQQCLIFNKEELQDSRTLSYYGIRRGCFLDLILRPQNKIKIFVTNLNRNLVVLELCEFDTHEHIKAKIQAKTGILPEQQNFSFAGREILGSKIVERWIEDEKSFSLEADVHDSIGYIKAIIEVKKGIPSNQQYLIFNDKKLEDGKILSEYKIQKENIFHLYFNPGVLGMKIFIKTTRGRLVTVELGTCDTSDQIKAKIKKIVGNSQNQQDFYFYKRFIKRGMIMEQWWMEGGKTFPLEVQSFNTIKNIKTIILIKEGIPPNQQCLIFNKEELDNKKMLLNYNIQEKSTLNLVLCPLGGFEIFIKSLCSDKIIVVELGPFDTNLQVKTKIQEKTGIPPDQQHFEYVGREIQGNKIMEKWKENEKTFPLKIENYYTIGYIKEIIFFKEEVLPCKQILTFSEIHLNDERTISNYNIQRNSVLTLTLINI